MDNHVVKCHICGADITIAHSTFTKKKNKIWTCKKCLGKLSSERYKNKPEEEKERLRELSRVNNQKYWANMSAEDKQKRLDTLNNGFRKYRDNMTDKDKEEYRRFCSERSKKMWSKFDSEKRKEMITPMREAYTKWYSELSVEDKKHYHDLLQEGNIKWWNGLSVEEREKMSQIRSKASHDYWDNITDEERKIHSDRMSNIIQSYWDNMTDAQYKEWDAKRAEGLNKYYEGLFDNINHNESSFMNILNINNIKYDIHWYNQIKHPDFSKVFKFNHITRNVFVSPYHQWDFKINLLERSILVDVDGSIHDKQSCDHEVTYPSGDKVRLSDLVEFNDSKRPYQTDGLDAYVIQCYDDSLNDNTIVVNIGTNEKMSFKSFISLLLLMNMSEKEQKEFIKKR